VPSTSQPLLLLVIVNGSSWERVEPGPPRAGSLFSRLSLDVGCWALSVCFVTLNTSTSQLLNCFCYQLIFNGYSWESVEQMSDVRFQISALRTAEHLNLSTTQLWSHHSLITDHAF